MRIALIADIHGNPLALDAVLDDIEARGGVDGYWILGDLCAIGFDPAGVLERLAKLPDALFVRGNADRYVTSGELPDPSFEQVRAEPSLIPLLAEVTGSFNWTKGYVTGRGWFGWLAALPTEHRLTLPDGTRVLLTHASPTGDDEGTGLNPSLTDDHIRAEIAGCGADLICVGHFHLAMARQVDGVQMINPGAVSNNFAPDLRASYAMLEANANGYRVNFHRAFYDLEAAKEATLRSGNPGAGYILRFLRGEVRASWMQHWDGVSHHPTITG